MENNTVTGCVNCPFMENPMGHLGIRRQHNCTNPKGDSAEDWNFKDGYTGNPKRHIPKGCFLYSKKKFQHKTQQYKVDITKGF